MLMGGCGLIDAQKLSQAGFTRSLRQAALDPPALNQNCI